MQIENENVNPDTVNPDTSTSKTVFKLNGFEVSMTEAEKRGLLEKLSTWKSKLVKLCICLVIAGLLSLIPFGTVGKSLITRGQEWIQSIQVEIEANKQLKQEQIEKEKAEKAAKEAERETAKEAEKIEETPDVWTSFKQTLQFFRPILLFFAIINAITLLIGIVRFAASISLEDDEGRSSSLMIIILAIITTGLTSLLLLV